MASAIVLVGCSPTTQPKVGSSPGDQSQTAVTATEEQKPGPCVAGLCMGAKKPTGFERCSAGISAYPAMTTENCYMKPGTLLLPGVDGGSADVLILNGEMAQASFSFHDKDCQKIEALMNRNLGAAGQNDAEYRAKYGLPSNEEIRLSNLLPGQLPPVAFGHGVWLLPTGRIKLTAYEFTESCVLDVDSVRANEMFKRERDRAERGVISG